MTNSILLVENDEDDVFFMQRAVEHMHISAVLRVVDNGEEAINYFTGKGRFDNREVFPLPDLVLLDLTMPLVDGFQVLEWVRDRPHLPFPIIIVSASRESSDMERSYDLGANAYHVKTPELQNLRDMVKGATQFWLGRNRPPFPSNRSGTQVASTGNGSPPTSLAHGRKQAHQSDCQ